jgi:hypothetical protein
MRRDRRDLRRLRFLTAPARLIGPRHHADDREIRAGSGNQSLEDVGGQLGRAHENNF